MERQTALGSSQTQIIQNRVPVRPSSEPSLQHSQLVFVWPGSIGPDLLQRLPNVPTIVDAASALLDWTWECEKEKEGGGGGGGGGGVLNEDQGKSDHRLTGRR